MATAISQNVRELIDACAERMSEVLVRTSIGALFFNASIAYAEEYESRNGFSKKPGMKIRVVHQLIGEDFERAKQIFADFEFHVADALAPIQGEIAHYRSIGETTKLSKLVSERECLARELRKASKQLNDTRNSDFAVLAKRLALHDITISQVWG
jgi:hypothetical protein